MPPAISPLYDTLGTEGTYTEFPVDLVTNIHWKKKTPPPPQPGDSIPIWVTQTGTSPFPNGVLPTHPGDIFVLEDFGGPLNDGQIGSIRFYSIVVNYSIPDTFYDAFGYSVQRPLWGVSGSISLTGGGSAGFSVQEAQGPASGSLMTSAEVPDDGIRQPDILLTYQTDTSFCHALWWMIGNCGTGIIGTYTVTIEVLDHFETVPG